MPEIEVADDVLASQPNGFSEFPGMFSGWSGAVCFLIKPVAADPNRALPELAAAAQAAVDRFQFVTAEGAELPGAWAYVEGDVPTGLVGPLASGDGVVVGASGEDGIWPPQAEMMLRIVVDELRTRNLNARVSCPPPALDIRTLPLVPLDVPRADASTESPKESAERWFIQRTVRTVTSTGVPYDDVEWLQPYRTWARAQGTAVSYADTADEKAEAVRLVIALREEADAVGGDPTLGEVNGVLTSPESHSRSHPMPPDTIRARDREE